jgi:hypothetical protein
MDFDVCVVEEPADARYRRSTCDSLRTFRRLLLCKVSEKVLATVQYHQEPHLRCDKLIVAFYTFDRVQTALHRVWS